MSADGSAMQCASPAARWRTYASRALAALAFPGTVIDAVPSGSPTTGANAKTVIASFSATRVKVKDERGDRQFDAPPRRFPKPAPYRRDIAKRKTGSDARCHP